MHCADLFFLSCRFEDMAIFHVLLSYDKGALSAQYRSIDKYVKNAHIIALSSQPPLKTNDQHRA